MDMITFTQEKRTAILNYIKPKMTFESYNWVASAIGDVNRKIVVEGNSALAAKIYPLFENFILFFDEFATEVTPGGLLMTFYICFMECGVTSCRRGAAKLKELFEEIDAEDFELVTPETLAAFDLRTNSLIGGTLQSETDNSIWACGLVTLAALTYHKALKEIEW